MSSSNNFSSNNHTLSRSVNDYAVILKKVIGDYNEFLNGLFSSFFKNWKGGYTILLPNGERIFETPKDFEPFCSYINEELNKRELCLKCDFQISKEVAKHRKPVDYWCDFGLRDIAVPIIVHNLSVGTILCGQKRLDGPEDKIGIEKLQNFIKINKLETFQDNLLNIREKCKVVDKNEIQHMKQVMMATSQYLSQLIDSIDIEYTYDVKYSIQSIFDSLSYVVKTTSSHTFWNELQYQILNKINFLFGSISISIWLADSNTTNCIAISPSNRNFTKDMGFDSKKNVLLNNSIETTEPYHEFLQENILLFSCPVITKILKHYQTSDEMLAAKARLDNERYILIYAFFDSKMDSGNLLYLHQKKSILTRFLTEIVNFYNFLEKVETLRQTIRERDQFIKDVAHQMNQPLHSIVSYADNLLDPLFSKERKERIPRYLLQRAKQGSVLARCLEYAARGAKDIFSQQKIELKPTKISRFLIDCAIDMQGYAEEENIKINVLTEETEPIGIVLIDSVLLQFGITNILFNGVKYSFPNTTLNLSVIVQDKELQLRFISYGIQIPKNMWEKIFSRGVRTKQAFEYSQSGLGIGLFVTRELMNRMNGKIIVESSNPTGRAFKNILEHKNVFLITLPYNPTNLEEKL